ncbi:MAG: hypothetical protein KKA79_04035 [Nanoarchaeota archaeon]|nr:hypothetical protein [Nanoarchaeota archaeon]MCG2718292.1 hypothetical protein [Nanoarchaeota archaeon]
MRKGQAAMEFLMTYGWAILVVLVAIGALAYFGVLSPARFLPSSCTIGPGFACEDFQVLAAGTWTINVRNGMGKALTGVDLDFDTVGLAPGGTGVGSCTPAAVPDGGLTVCTGGVGSISVGTAGDKVKATINFDYSETGTGALAHTKTGLLTTTME